MKPTSNGPASPLRPGADPQILGELELRVGSDDAHAIHSWLIETLSALDLSADFVNRISKSAQEAVLRATEPGGVAATCGHIHLLVFAPRPGESERNGKTWGFFRIDKLDGLIENQNLSDHSIEFYLYVEGE